MSLSNKVVTALQQPLNRAHVSQRDSYGSGKLDYIESHHAIREANRIFGHGGWLQKVISVDCRFDGENPSKKGQWLCSYTATVQVAVQDEAGNWIPREDVGYGNGFAKKPGEAHELASKEAVSDAVKRCLRTFGDPFGLVLYEKSDTKRAENMIERLSAAEAKRQGLSDQIKELLNGAGNVSDLDERWEVMQGDHMQRIPLSWHDSVKDIYETKREELSNVS